MDSHRRMLALLALTCVGVGGILSAYSPQAPSAGPHPDGTIVPPPRVASATIQVGTTAADRANSPLEAHPSEILKDSEYLAEDVEWLPGQMIVRATTRDDLVDLAEELQARVVHSTAVDGLGVLLLPEGMEVADAQAQLEGHPEVADFRRHALVRGASDGVDGTASSTENDDSDRADIDDEEDYRQLQWHRRAVGTLEAAAHATTRVAVLDSGMAFATGSAWTPALGVQQFYQAKTLGTAPLVDSWDFIYGTIYPVDENHHGTHITSLIASRGTVEGMSKGVSLLPFRVLDAWSNGSELGLIDALHWAVDAEADIINMSLSFGGKYTPSPELLDALELADDAGIVMLAAAGNNGEVGSTWPAASPHVISVGASCMTTDSAHLGPAPYSNYGGDVDILAPGGCLDRDANHDGHPDGILAESFALNQPDKLGWFWFEGTSQATAVTTGVVARLLEGGVPADRMRTFLQLGSTPIDDVGHGAGHVSLQGSYAMWQRLKNYRWRAPEFGAVVTPWLQDLGDETAPAARILVVDAHGQPADGVTVRGHFRGTTNSVFTCVTNQGTCDVVGEPTDELVTGWAVSVAGAGRHRALKAPFRMALVDPSSATLLDAAAEHLTGMAALADGSAPMGYMDPGSDVEGLGATAPSLSFVGGSGISTSPFGIILSPGMLDRLGSVSSEIVGSGISTSPFGIITIKLPEGDTLFAIEGSGIQTSPFGALPPVPGKPGCIGSSECDETLVLDTGGTIGAVSGSSAGLAMGASTSLGVVGASIQSECDGGREGVRAMTRDAVPLDARIAADDDDDTDD